MFKPVCLLVLAASANAAISILYPTSNDIWYENNTVALNWTLSDPSSDTFLFRTLLSNQDQSLLAGNHSIADSTNPTATYVRVLLPQLVEGKGYVVNFVNTSNEAQVFATSQAFEIQAGMVSYQTTIPATTGSPTDSASSGNDIPNFSSSSSSTNPFASASHSAGAGKVGASGLGLVLSSLLAYSVL